MDSLELGEDDMLELDDNLSPLGEDLDNDFQLTPVADLSDDEGDSGSQVIALDEADFGGSAADLVTEEGGFLEEGDAGEAVFVDEDEDSPAVPAGLSSKSAVAIADTTDASYSLWNVLGLFGIVSLLAFAGILLVDLINNMWSWQGTYRINSSIMDAILDNLMP